jgi:prevent-host-death family protein
VTTLSKAVSANVSKLKLHLGKYLKMVRRGRDVIVLDRSTPVAKLVPYTDDAAEVISTSAPTEDPAELAGLRFEPVEGGTNSVEFLLTERRERGV